MIGFHLGSRLQRDTQDHGLKDRMMSVFVDSWGSQPVLGRWSSQRTLSTGCSPLPTSAPLFGFSSGRYGDVMPIQYSLRRAKTPARFPNRIREYRLRAGITQLRLAEIVGRTRSVISAWERGHRLPSIPNLFKLAKTLDTLGESLYSSMYLGSPAGSATSTKEA